MSSYVLGLRELDQTRVAEAGGKGANLGELSRIAGVRVPAGFCVTTRAYRDVVAGRISLAPLARLKVDDHDGIRKATAEVREAIEALAMPSGLSAELTAALTQVGDHLPFAVRSSATAEDLPSASFAGQQDTFLNVAGAPAILEHVRRCWASLFTERAVTYRLRHGFPHHQVFMAVVVQRLVSPRASGVMFTADPVTSNRKVASIEASFGLGEALVSGLVNADAFKVREGQIVSRAIATKRLAIEFAAGGGTRQQLLSLDRGRQPALSDEEVVRLVQLGRQIETHFGRPQDIEWCLLGDDFHVVQSRPITTLFPPPATNDGATHVYLSVGHQQMMTDAMRPLGLSVWQLTAARPIDDAGGRLFVDVTRALASPAARAGLLDMAGKSDPLMRDALQTVIDRGIVPSTPEAAPPGPPPGFTPPPPLENDPAIPAGLIAKSEASLAALKRDIEGKAGTALLDFIAADIQALKKQLLEPQVMQAIMAAMESTWWLNEKLHTWLGETNAADTLTLSAPNNVTSQMGLELMELADLVRPHPDVVASLERATDDAFVEGLPPHIRDALVAWLEKYGMRGVGEIDITRPRWSEHPTLVLPMLLGNVRSFEPGAAARRFEHGRREAERKASEVLDRLRELPNGEQKAAETKRNIERLRTFIGYREYPKYGIVSRYFVYKQALQSEAARLVKAGVLRAADDIDYLRFEELQEVVRSQRADAALVQRRREAFRGYEALTPPRVLTSEGETFAGVYRREGAPHGALVGLGVSAGTVEGRARVVSNVADAQLEPGDILVTAYTDPSWTPLFVGIKGLVAEVGGLMTHGAVIAREYGLPAVVGVPGATRKIRDGQRVRIDGSNGYVELLPAIER
ncbi:MAG: phosphoenolpyruvate synthase [Myxococcaceae bacterium]|nr:phosphoenolpyruvate synthase [Myxococcaceae bacterium]